MKTPTEEDIARGLFAIGLLIACFSWLSSEKGVAVWGTVLGCYFIFFAWLIVRKCQ